MTTAKKNPPADTKDSREPLTARQAHVLEVLQELSNQLSYPPSVRELAEALGLSSPSSVKHHLDMLEQKGYLKRNPNSPRALEILNATPPAEAEEKEAAVVTIPVGISDDEPAAPIPLVGQIAAGTPILAEQQVEDVFTIPRYFTGSGELFMLKVHGESMIDAAICPGDWVIVRQQNSAEPGEIVAALLDDEATVKVLSYQDGHCWLLPRNPDYSPILGDHATILGKVVTVIRSL